LDREDSHINRLLAKDRTLSIDKLFAALPEGLVSRSTVATFRTELLAGEYDDILSGTS
jgi:hypothetical protein